MDDYRRNKLVTVDVALEGTLDIQTKVIGLDGGELGQLGVDVLQVEEGNLLIEDLRKDVDTNLLLAGGAEFNVLLAERSVLGLEQGDLSENLVGERAGHDEGRVASSASEVNKTALSEEDDVTAVGHQETVDLRLDALHGLGVGLKPGNVNLDIKVTNVYTSLVIHLAKGTH